MSKRKMSRKEMRKEEALKENQIVANKIMQENDQRKFKEIIGPTKIDTKNFDYLEIFSKVSMFARTFYVTTVPKEVKFPYFLAPLYQFGDASISIYINPIPENVSIRDLNNTISDLEDERTIAVNRGDINRLSVLQIKKAEAEDLRDQIANGYNRLFSATMICTIFAYNKNQLDKYSESLTFDASKSQIGLKTAWAQQREGFQSNLPLNNNKITRKHTFDRGSMATVFPFVNDEAGMDSGVPIGINKQTGLPLIFDNFSNMLSNYNMLVFGQLGAGKSLAIKTIIARSSVLTGVKNFVIDTTGEYESIVETLRGRSINLINNMATINMFDLETEIIKDEITGKERYQVDIDGKIEDVTRILISMAKASDQSDFVNEITRQIVLDSVKQEYQSRNVTSNPDSLYENNFNTGLGRGRKKMPTITSWYNRVVENSKSNTNPNYTIHYEYLLQNMKNYCSNINEEMDCIDGQTNINLDDNSSIISINISNIKDEKVKCIIQQIALVWAYEKYIKKNSEDRNKAAQKRVVVDNGENLAKDEESLVLLNVIARRSLKRNVALTIISNEFTPFYENSDLISVLMNSEVKLFMSQNQSEILDLKDDFNLTEGESRFLINCSRGEGIIKIGYQSAIITIKPTQRELEFAEVRNRNLLNRSKNR